MCNEHIVWSILSKLDVETLKKRVSLICVGYELFLVALMFEVAHVWVRVLQG